MRSRRIAVVTVATTLLLSTVGLAQEMPAEADERPPSLQQITTLLDDLYRSRASVGRIELTVTSPRQNRTLRMRVWTRGEDESLIVIESPARERGTATLRRDRNLWNYLPRISRTIRVPPSMMLSSWMGSDFTNDDLTQSSSFRDDFVGEVVGRAENNAGWVVRFDARDGVVGLWRRIEYVMSDEMLPAEARYYDRRMRLARIMRFEDVREMDGRRIPTRLVIVPQDREGHRTEMRYISMDFDANVSASTFSLSQLERRR